MVKERVRSRCRHRSCPLNRGIDLGAGSIGTAAAVYVAGACVGALFFGQLTDRFGRVRTLQITVLWFSIATFASAFAQNFEQFLVLKAIQGFGFGGSGDFFDIGQFKGVFGFHVANHNA